jgi:phosphonate transport system substrate-binding protein
MKKILILLSILLVTVVIILNWVFYKNSIDITIKESDDSIVYSEVDKPVKYFGVVSRYSPREIFFGYQPIMDFLTENTQYKFELKLNTSYEGTAQQLANGEISIASLGSLVYVSLQNEYDLEVILKPLSKEGFDYYTSMFITQDTSSIQTLSDLKNRSVLLPSKESLTGKWMPIYLFEQSGINLNDLKKLSFTLHHTTVAEKVLNGEVDAGVVKEAVSDIFIDRGLRIFHIAPKRTSIPIVVSKFTDYDLKQSVIDAFLSIDINDPTTQEMLKTWDEELSYGFAIAKDSDYQMVRGLLPKLSK